MGVGAGAGAGGGAGWAQADIKGSDTNIGIRQITKNSNDVPPLSFVPPIILNFNSKVWRRMLSANKLTLVSSSWARAVRFVEKQPE